MKFAKLLVFGAVAIAVVGCASGVRRDESVGPSGGKLADPKVASINVKVGGDAAMKFANGDRGAFTPAGLRGAMEFHLRNRGLLSEGAPQRIEVEVTDYRLRNAVSAVLLGFMAGADSLKGTVTVFGADDKPITKFEVSASYALGGSAGGQDSARLGWLYTEFAKLTADELLGVGKK